MFPLLTTLTLFIWMVACPDDIAGQIVDPDELIADTLHVPMDFVSSDMMEITTISVADHHEFGPRILDVRQVNKYLIIPVDQYLVVSDSLSVLFQRFLGDPLPHTDATLHIGTLDLWHDGKPFFATGWMLNAETRLVDGSGETVSVWQWELKRNPPRKEEFEETVSMLMMDWFSDQQTALLQRDFSLPEVTRPYRRTLNLWMNTLFFQDGYALDGRLSLYYPGDQQRNSIRGVPGMYYRKSPVRESIAIGGNNILWSHRMRSDWLFKLDGTFRVGFNQFKSREFEHIDWYNLLFVNIGLSQSIDWMPRYYKGIYAGIGVHQSINILPNVIEWFEPGVQFTVGLRLP